MACASRMSWRKDSSAISARVGIRRCAIAVGERVPRGLAGFKREALQRFERGFADAARGSVDDALQRHRVVRIADQAQVAEQVLDLGALVKAESADHGVADVVAAQRFFNQARLRVGAIEHGAVRLVAGLRLIRGEISECGRR